MADLKVTLIRQASEALQLYGSVTSRDIADGAATQGVKIERGQVELDKPIKTLGTHKIKIHLHPEVAVEISVLVARSPDEAEFLAKGGTLVAETERAALEAAEAAQRAAAQAAALFEAKPAEAGRRRRRCRERRPRPRKHRPKSSNERLVHSFWRMPPATGGMRFSLRARATLPALPAMIWRVGAVVIAGIVALPLLGVASSLFTPQGDLWRHLADTQLADIFFNTLVLLLVRRLRHHHHRRGHGVAGDDVQLPRQPPAAMGAAAAAGPADLYHRLRLRRPSGLRRARAGRAAPGHRLEPRRLLVPRPRLGGRRRPALHAGPLPLRLSSPRAPPSSTQSHALIEASRILGHGPWRTFFGVGLPLARPAIAAGVVLALLEALADFGTVQYYGVQTLTTAIYRTWYGLGNREGAAQIALVLIAIAGLLILVERRSRGRARFSIASNLRHQGDPAELCVVDGGGRAPRACTPAHRCWASSCRRSIWRSSRGDRAPSSAIESHFLGDAPNSLGLAAAAAVIIVALALFLSYAGRLVRRRALNRLIEFSALGYAIPGAVIAVGILLPLALADHGIDRLSRAILGLPSGLLLSGTAFALLLAYTVRFLAVGLANIAPGLAAIDPAMDASARVLGARPREVLRRIHLPLLRGPMLTAAVVAFVEVMKELPATLLIRPVQPRYAGDRRLPLRLRRAPGPGRGGLDRDR